MNPVIQTSGGTSYIEGLEDRTFQYVFSDASIDAVEESDVVVALGTELGEGVGDDRLDEVLLRREVVVEGAERDVGALGDLLDAQPGDALLADERAAGVDEAAAGALAAAPRHHDGDRGFVIPGLH